MRIVLSGGGTAGHINPALALAETLEEQGHEVFYAGTPQGVEARLVKEAGLPFKAFEASGFDRAHPLTLPKALRTIQKSTKRAKEWFAEIKPDVVVAFGGYVCIPVSRAAEALGIPLVSMSRIPSWVWRMRIFRRGLRKLRSPTKLQASRWRIRARL